MAESKKLSQESMKDATQRLIDVTCEKYPENIEVREDGSMIANVKVSIDGTWQKRGHSSKHGVIFIVAVDTGELLC